MFSKVAVSFTFLSTLDEGSHFFTSWPTFVIVCLLTILVGIKWYLTVVLICIFLWGIMMLSISSCTYYLFIYLLWWTLCSCLCPFVDWVFLSYWAIWSLYIAQVLNLIWSLQMFLLVCCLSFHFCNDVFWSTTSF